MNAGYAPNDKPSMHSGSLTCGEGPAHGLRALLGGTWFRHAIGLWGSKRWPTAELGAAPVQNRGPLTRQ
jgi:hypothetical protein